MLSIKFILASALLFTINIATAEKNAAPQPTVKISQISTRSKNFDHALYLFIVFNKLEHLGIKDLPIQKGKKNFGSLLASIPISTDGTIYKDKGGIKIIQSSGDKELDAAFIEFVEAAAPLKPIPENLRTRNKSDVFELMFNGEDTPYVATGAAPKS
ncbi:energy transducer TonB family protein [Undibacterium sp. Ji42W]|uniref:energy transducer TonB family protein n=1 Tax=Undibacterium sp. Ji42W TaxID=3413039 RepID=UPI003BF2DECF